MMEIVRVSTGSRLHFGLLRFAQAEGPSYGGVGMMIDRPRLDIELSPAKQWVASGPEADRALTLSRRAFEAMGGDAGRRAGIAALNIRVRSSIPPHRGLGGGTQLGMAIAAGVRSLLGLPPATAAELSAAVGRGERSAVGSHGFLHGGLIWETGRRIDQPLGCLKSRLAIPDPWRIVLVSSPNVGLSGQRERDAFAHLPPVPESSAGRLTELVEQEILPAAKAGQLDAFGQAVFEYGRLAGQCFAAVQGGAYGSATIAACVDHIRSLGVRGVGQSSWGPTVFAITGSEDEAESVKRQLATQSAWSNHEIQIAAPDNRGAAIELHPSRRAPSRTHSRP